MSVTDNVLNLLGDNAVSDSITGAATSSYTALSVASDANDRYEEGSRLDFAADGTFDVALVTAIASTTSLTVSGGQFGSTQAAHSNGARFRVNPTFYSFEVNRAINDSIASDLYPELFAVYEAQFSPSTTWSAETTLIKSIDATAEDILRAYQRSDSTPTDLRDVSFSTDSPFFADTTTSATNKAIKFTRIPDDNNVIFVQYIRAPAAADLSEGMQRVVEYGAARRLLERYGARLLQRTDIDQGGVHAPGGAQREARWFLAMQQEAKLAERAVLRARYPMRRPRWRPSVRRKHYTSP